MRIGAISVAFVLAFLTFGGAQTSVAQHSDDATGEFIFDGDAVVLPLSANEMHPRVAIDIGDGELYEFIVDTGAEVNVIDSKVAEDQGYEVIGDTEIGAPGGPQIPASIVKVPLLRVGAATIRDAEFVTMDIAGFSRGTTQGVLGLPLFRDLLLTFDQGQGEIRVSREQLSAGDTGVLPYNEVSEHIQIDVDYAGTTVATHVDTGSMGSFMLPAKLMDVLPLQEAPQSASTARLVGGERDIQFAQLTGAVKFAGANYENPNIAFMSPSADYGNVGSRVLSDFVVSVDQRNHLIRFQKAAMQVAVAMDNKPRPLGVMFRGMSDTSDLAIGRVDPGSLAESAGLLAGDKLVALNGQAAGEYDMAELGTLFRSSTPLSIGIERDGEMKTIEIP